MSRLGGPGRPATIILGGRLDEVRRKYPAGIKGHDPWTGTSQELRGRDGCDRQTNHDRAIYLKEDRYDRPKEIFKRMADMVAPDGESPQAPGPWISAAPPANFFTISITVFPA